MPEYYKTEFVELLQKIIDNNIIANIELQKIIDMTKNMNNKKSRFTIVDKRENIEPNNINNKKSRFTIIDKPENIEPNKITKKGRFSLSTNKGGTKKNH